MGIFLIRNKIKGKKKNKIGKIRLTIGENK